MHIALSSVIYVKTTENPTKMKFWVTKTKLLDSLQARAWDFDSQRA